MGGKVVLLSSILALFLAAFITSNALASFTGNRLGRITNISANQVTFTTLSGGTNMFLVSSSTRYYAINGLRRSYGNLVKGRYVDVVGQVGWPDAPGGVLSASTVILLPGSINPAQWNNARDYGKVTSVNKTGNSFVLAGRYGSVTYIVNSGTTFLGDIGSINDLKQGMRALIASNGSTHRVLAIVAFWPQ